MVRDVRNKTEEVSIHLHDTNVDFNTLRVMVRSTAVRPEP